jgi:hypothetical protein
MNLDATDQINAVARQAGAELDRAVALAPDSIEVRELRGYASFYTPSEVGRDQLAIEDFNRATEVLERLPKTEDHRAELYLILRERFFRCRARRFARAYSRSLGW